MRSTNLEPVRNWLQLSLDIRKAINRTKENWPEAIIVLVIPSRHWFYAVVARDFEIQTGDSKKGEPGEGIHLNQLEKFEEIFRKSTIERLREYKDIVAKIFGIFGAKRDYLLEEKFLIQELENFLRERPGLSKGQLWDEYVKLDLELITREEFCKLLERLLETKPQLAELVRF